MKIDLEFAELHNPLFLGGKNHQMKLVSGDRSGLRLVYDRAEKELIVFWKGPKGEHEAIVPCANVSCMWPAKPEEEPEFKAPAPQVAKVTGRTTAQVSSPTDHVFAGEGKGKTGKL